MILIVFRFLQSVFFSLIFVLTLSQDAFSQTELRSTEAASGDVLDISEVWARHARPLPTDGSAGLGWDWLEQEARESQFVLIGEQHYVAAIPALTVHLLVRLKASDYDALALEISPWLGRRATSDGARLFLYENPFELSFNADGLVALMEYAKGEGFDIWGLDQPVTAIHSLRRLSEILPTRRARKMARGLYLKAAFQRGRYIQSSNFADLALLRDAAGTDLGEEAVLLLSSIEKSMEIYLAYHAGQRGDGPRGQSDQIREAYMVENFRSRFQQDGNGQQKVIVLMGGSHVMEGVGPNGIRTLGDEIQNMADANGSAALHITAYIYDPQSNAAPPESVFGDHESVIVDLRAIRKATDGVLREALDPEMRRNVEQFDAAIFLRGSAAGRDLSTEISSFERGFRHSLVQTLAFPLLTLLVLSTLLLTWGRVTYRSIRFDAEPSKLAPFAPWVLISLITVALSGIFVLQMQRLSDISANAALTSSPTAFLGIGMAIVLTGLGICAWWKRFWSFAVRMHFILLVLAGASLGGFIYHWNLGGMLG